MIGLLLALSYLVSYFAVPALAKMMQARLVHFNHRNHEIPVGLGIVFIIVVVPLILLGMLLQQVELLFGFLTVLTALSFGILGFIDDTIGSREARGFAGHFRALLQGQLTTGALKAIFGGTIALLLAVFTSDNWLIIIINSLTIALMANFTNLLDVRPGRTGKFYILITGILFFLGGGTPVLLLLLGSVLAYLPWDLQGKVMMGDSGANTLGAVLGLAITQQLLPIKTGALFLLVVLHFFAERSSFTLIIENNKVLNYIDQLGRSKL